MKRFYSCGKLLLTGEYLVLRGARGLALPTSRGQSLAVSIEQQDSLTWTAFDEQSKPWYTGSFDLNTLAPLSTQPSAVDTALSQLLQTAQLLNPSFLNPSRGAIVETRLDFPRDWGLGSSSTLVHNVAAWADVDPYQLLQQTMGGSGYDVMVAHFNSPIIFSRNETGPIVKQVAYQPLCQDEIWFVHLGRKQGSAQEITRFNDIKVAEVDIQHVSLLTDELLITHKRAEVERILTEHDLLLSRILAIPTASELFPKAPGYVKYLGAWGGDFMLATGKKEEMQYFKELGLDTVLSYQEMIAHD
jgi:mevalonate kinase